MRLRYTTGLLLLTLALGFQPALLDDFSFAEDEVALTIMDGDEPVLSVVHGRMAPPEGISDAYARSNYIHPVYGLDGTPLTEDFPEDHPHHRGVFWAWPEVTVGDRVVDPWALEGAQPRFSRWLERETAARRATLSFESGWHLDGSEEPFVVEQVSITVHPAEEVGRAIDFRLHFQNVSEELVTLRGRGETGYGGFNIRPDGSRPGNRITTATGVHEDDALVVESGWADYSFEVTDAGIYAGLALFQHPDNPGFPHSGWLLRHYGFLGASWPQYEPFELAPEEVFELAYRLFVHRGDAEDAAVADRFESYVREASATEW